MNCYLYNIESGNGVLHLLSPLSKEELAGLETRSELFVGRLIDAAKGTDPDNISYNSDFLVILHQLVRDIMVEDEDVLRKAEEQPNGFVFIIDQRAPEGEQIEKEDIIGIFLVNDRKTDVSRYRPNPDYKLISNKGPGLFPAKIENALREKLMGL